MEILFINFKERERKKLLRIPDIKIEREIRESKRVLS